MMFRKILSALTVLGLFITASSSAVTLDGGEIRFRGYVIDESPKWTWRMASQEQSWSVDIADGIAEGKNWRFDLSNKGILPFLEGHLKKVAERGGPGLNPVITLSSDGQPFTLPEGGNTTDQRYRAAVPVMDAESGTKVGQLSFTVEQGLAVSLGRQQESGIATMPGMLLANGSVTQVQAATLSSGLSARLSELMLQNQDFGTDISAVFSGQVLQQSMLSNTAVTRIAAAYGSVLSDFSLQLPKDNSPSHWKARLGVTVTVQ